ncbi:Uncharacterized protein Adt_34010 [Abeliophyllum distichum]|uniref:DUF6570 domain-containing protein n=1 Tax=Abeliophyllum distichum TaxID=126358 RepID=A0ABD1R1J6_9LAMI
MDPGVVPIELSRLTNLEQILIVRVHPMMSVYRVKGQQYKYSGNVINFAQDVNSIATVLPFKPSDLSAILIVNRTRAHVVKEFRVRHEYVRQALVWLKQNHLYYRDITIDEYTLQTLPHDGIPEDIPHSNEDNEHNSNANPPTDVVEDDIEGPPEIVNQNVHIDEFHAVGTISVGPQPNQQACIHKALHVADADRTIAHMHLTNKVIDEFSTPGYISMVFPALFPHGNADFRQARPRKLNPSEYFQYLMKYIDGRFAKDSRFRYFAWNSISRWRALALGDVYVNKNPMDAELSIQDIQNMVASGDKHLAIRISYYAKSIRGTRAYWKVLQTWRANIDWSPVLSVESVIHYIAKYASKAEPASKTFTETLRQIVDDIRRPCPTAISAIKRLLIKSVSERDISAQEACHLLMGYPLTKSSRKFVLLNVSDKSMFSSTVRRSHGAHGEDVVGTDPSFVIRYMSRPSDYENLSLLQMAKKHYFSNNIWHKSKIESIVRIIPEIECNVLVQNGEKWELYCRQQVLLHYHYRSLVEAKGEFETWSIRYFDLGLALNDTVNTTELVNDEFEEDEDIYLEVEGVPREEWMFAASMGP